MTQTDHSQPFEMARTHWPLLGAVVDVRVAAVNRSDAERAEQVVCDELTRLERLFSIEDENSLLRRWMADSLTPTCNEFDELLALALRWQRCSRGAFNVSARRLGTVWKQAATDGCRPSSGELHDLVVHMADPPFRFDGGRLCRSGDCAAVDLNAIAKGFIVDLASQAAWRVCDIDSLTLNADGVIVHSGSQPMQVGIDLPTSRGGHPPPLPTLTCNNAAVATSGSQTIAVEVDNDWISHVFDPRTGWPADMHVAVTVRAESAATAGVVATIVRVMGPTDGVAFVQALNSSRRAGHPSESFDDLAAGPVSCWIVGPDGTLHSAGPPCVSP